MKEIIDLSKSLPGIWYQITCWAKTPDGRHSKSKKFVSPDRDEATSIFFEMQKKAERLNVEHPEFKFGVCPYVYKDGGLDLALAFQWFCDYLTPDSALVSPGD